MGTVDSEIETKDGIKIIYNVSRYGNGLCVVFLHGIGGDLSVWNNIRNDFDDQQISTIALDLRGHGRSGISNNINSYHIDNLVGDLTEVLRRENFDKYVLVGHSLGGMIAIVAAENKTPKVVSLVLLDTGYKSPIEINDKLLHKIIKFISKFLPESRNTKRRNYDEFGRTNNLSLDRWLSDISHTSIKSWLMTIDGIAHFDAGRSLIKIKIPTLILTGKNDLFFPNKDEETMAAKIKKSELIILPNLNHICIITNPSVVAKEILNFVKEKVV